MQRRHFIRLSSAAIGSLLIPEWSLASDDTYNISVQLDDGIHTMQSIGNGVFTFREVRIRLLAAGPTVRIIAESPKEPLHFIRLSFFFPPEKAASILGDHWERTYGDLGFFQPSLERKMPWYCVAYDGKRAACLGVKTGARSIAYWQLHNDKLELNLDTRSGGIGVTLGDRMLDAATIVATEATGDENVYATARRFCRMLCDKPRLPQQPVYGINDWYYTYGNNSAGLILELTSLMTDLAPHTDNRPFSVIDAGWAEYSPLKPGDGGWMDDFSRPNDKFKDMAVLAGKIKKLGMRPGLWTRPLCASYKDPKNLLLPSIPGRDDPKSPVLDPTIPENLDRIRHNIALYKQWGYEMVKHDFTTYDMLGKWGFQMKDDITTSGWRFLDNTKTTAEIALDLYNAIREAAGDSMYIIGCNTFSHLSAGIFELDRVGDDTSGKEWDRTRKMGVNTLGFRMIQHDNFYAADGDCVGLTLDVPWQKNKQWMQLVAGSGSPLFISPQPDALGAEQKQSIKASFAQAARKLTPGEPLDWLTNPFPNKWKLDGETKTFDWS